MWYSYKAGNIEIIILGKYFQIKKKKPRQIYPKKISVFLFYTISKISKMTRSVLTLYNLNQESRYIYGISIFAVIIGLGVWIFVQNSDTSENTIWGKDISWTGMEIDYPVWVTVLTQTGMEQQDLVEDIVAISTGNTSTTFTGLILQDIPFTSQAPFSEWWNIIFQEGCEEAATIMAIAWATDKPAILADDANTQILSIADYEQKEFWTHMHASIYDIATTMSDYLWFYDHRVVENISKTELIQLLRDWHIVMVPTSGRALKNSYYTPPGPRNHIVLIIGYDSINSEFITNDSGTKNGASYRYDEDLIYDAIGYYATSATDSGSLIDTNRKSGIVISKTKS